jgi:putative peptide zinc metalloprotease protein
MTEVHSSRWYRVAHLTPSLSPQIELRRQRLRGETWYMLSDRALGRSVRLNASAYAIVGRIDGQSTVQQLWDRSLLHAQEAVTQDELIDILAQLREAALLQFDKLADFDLLLPHLERVARPGGRNSLLDWRIPLGNPSVLLAWLRPLQAVLFSRAAFAIWLLLALTLIILGMQHAPELSSYGQRWLRTPRFAGMALVLYVPIKLVHELAHGLAVRRWGGQVREVGVTLMLLMPVPYVDASAATSFVQRRHRVLVGAAGIMAEVSLAALALPLWLWLDDGLWRDAAFATLVIAGISTLMFNGNPLQRLDGYYILTDVFELPNLASRSRSWWFDGLRRLLLGVPATETMPVAHHETPWLACYAPLSWLYILFVVSLAVAWIGQISFTLGMLCGTLLAWQIFLRPVFRLVKELRRSALSQERAARRWQRLATWGSVTFLLLVLAPFPQHTLVQGVVWPADQAQLRADEAGFVDAVLVSNGQSVKAGEAVVQLANPQLQSSHQVQSAKVAALEATLFDAVGFGKSQDGEGRAGDASAELAAAQAELDRLSARLAALVVRAHSEGTVVLPNETDLPGQFVRRGTLMGQILTHDALVVRIALPEAQASDLLGQQDLVSVRLASEQHLPRLGRLTRDSIGAVWELPSAALSDRHGGDIATDPSYASALKPLQPVVLQDVRMTDLNSSVAERIGQRAWVRFENGWSPLLLQFTRSIKRQVLRRFNPQY